MWNVPISSRLTERVTIFSPMGFFNDGNGYDSVAVCMLSSFDENTGKMELSENYQLFDYGIDLYAPQSTTDKDGNRVVIAWARMPEAVITEKGEWCGMMCIPRIVDVKNNHVYIRPHTNVKNSFCNKAVCSEKSGYMLKTTLKNGESINVGGYVIKRENDKITTDRSKVFNIKGNYRLIAETLLLTKDMNLRFMSMSISLKYLSITANML